MAEIISCCLGPAKNEGTEMTQWVLNTNGQVVPQRSLRWLRPDGLISDVEIEKMSCF